MDRKIVRRRHLPHWDVPGAAYFVTTCLEGSIPAQGLLDIAKFRSDLRRRPRPKGTPVSEWRIQSWKREFVRIESWLDEHPARRELENPALARVVVDSLFRFAGERYDLWAYVVMPSHMHWLFQPRPAWVETLADDRRTPRQRITYSLNRFTATACNRLLKVQGPFWQTESYDHWVRDVDELQRIIGYIEYNPVKARLAAGPDEWQFSSASARKAAGAEWRVPLSKDLQ